MRRHAHRVAAVLWSGFLVAAGLELAVFAFVDPQTLHGLSGDLLHASTTAVYSLAFFVFWAAGAAGAALSLLLAGSAQDINAAGVERPTRPASGPGSGVAPS
jgi:hypothetical protein